MRILLAIHNAYTDATSGAAHSMRILMQWLADGGHECQVLGTARFDAKPPDSLDDHFEQLDVPLQKAPPSKIFTRSVRKPANMVVGRPTVDFTLEGVPVTTLLTTAHTGSAAERFEVEQFLFLLEDLLRQFAPDVLVTYGGHPVVQESMRRARERGVVCVFSLRNRGYEDRTFFRHVDHVFTTSPYLSETYRQKIGLKSTGIESPIEWAEVEAPTDMRKFVTFVNPSIPKGAMLFARLADMLGQSRSDIPLLIVQSASGAGGLNAIAGLDLIPRLIDGTHAADAEHADDVIARAEVLTDRQPERLVCRRRCNRRDGNGRGRRRIRGRAQLAELRRVVVRVGNRERGRQSDGSRD